MSSQKTRHPYLNSYWVMNNPGEKPARFDECLNSLRSNSVQSIK